MRARVSIDALVLTGILICSSIFIIMAARGNLWFDEVLSLQWASKASHPWEILSLYRHDNNHPLNTLWIYFMGVGRPEIVYRGLSITAGILLPFLTFIASRRLSPRAWFVPVMLVAFSYPVVLYASEARGYAPAMALSLAAFVVLLERPEPGFIWTPLFWLLSCLALLAHSTAVFPLAAMGGWSLLRLLPEWKTSLGRVILLFAPPALLFIGFFWFFLSRMMIAGGPDTGPVEVLSEFFGFWLGLPAGGVLGWMSPAIGAILLAVALILGRFPVKSLRLFFLFSLAGFPVVVLIASGENYVHFRYLVVILPFLSLLIGCLAERVVEDFRGWKFVILPLLGIFIGMQAPRMLSLVALGRGNPVDAIARILSESPHGVTVASNHEMLVGMVFEHYRRQLPDPRSVRYLMKHQTEVVMPDWVVISHQGDPSNDVSGDLEAFGGRFTFVATFPGAPASGTHWTLYKNEKM